MVRIGALVVTVLLAVASPAHGADVVGMKVRPNGELVDGGNAVLVTVQARCARGLDVLEAFVYVVQDDETSAFASVPAFCDGRPHRFVVRVAAVDVVFRDGPARVNGYILVSTPEGSSDNVTRVVRIRG